MVGFNFLPVSMVSGIAVQETIVTQTKDGILVRFWHDQRRISICGVVA